MLKKLLALCAALLAAAAFAAVDANKATQAELESVKGIGPVISTLILGERKKGAFKDWGDFVDRVKGVGEASATKFSEGGLTINGKSYAGAPAAKAQPGVASKAASAARQGGHAVAEKAREAKAKVSGTPIAASGPAR